jgi:hypothetical protein
MKFKIITKKTIPDEEGQKLWKARKSRRRILAVLIVLAILMLLVILRPSVIRKKHLKIYGGVHVWECRVSEMQKYGRVSNSFERGIEWIIS